LLRNGGVAQLVRAAES